MSDNFRSKEEMAAWDSEIEKAKTITSDPAAWGLIAMMSQLTNRYLPETNNEEVL